VGPALLALAVWLALIFTAAVSTLRRRDLE
jgi:hypothetical protein